MTVALPKGLTADEFLAWAAGQPGRYELVNGEIVTMAAERVGHARAKLAAVTALTAAIEARRLPCEAMIDGVAVRIDDATVYEPDALVRCGERVGDDAIFVTDPVIVVEVVSPSSQALDSGAKLEDYFRLPSLRHYLIVKTDTRAVIHHRAGGDGRLETAILREGRIELDPPGIGIELAALFAG
jgi:Uma2 family endonuclease